MSTSLFDTPSQNHTKDSIETVQPTDDTANETTPQPGNVSTTEAAGQPAEDDSPKTEGVQAEPSETVTAQNALIKIEGQEFSLDVQIAGDDTLLKTALKPHYPSIENASVTRETRAGQMIVSIVKKAQHKG